MTDTCSERLLGYLLGALDAAEEKSLERRLETDPDLRRRLVELRSSLGPLDAGRCAYEPPMGLAAQTCELVARKRTEPRLDALQTVSAVSERPRPASVAAPPVQAEAGPSERSQRWSWLDVAVAAAVVLVTSAMVFPAIHNSRFQARVAACQNNLRDLGAGLVRYSQLNKGYFPRVPSQGRLASAGIYAPTLISGGFLTNERSVVCPSSALAGVAGYKVPSLTALEAAPSEELRQVLPTAGGSYGYSLGYTDDGVYRDTRNLSRRNFALLADVPSTKLPQRQSYNHGGRGQNVLFEDMHVEFLTRPQTFDKADDVYLNDHGQVAPGSHRDDSVIAPSTSSPELSAVAQ